MGNPLHLLFRSSSSLWIVQKHQKESQVDGFDQYRTDCCFQIFPAILVTIIILLLAVGAVPVAYNHL
jgi:hypothetical protein